MNGATEQPSSRRSLSLLSWKPLARYPWAAATIAASRIEAMNRSAAILAAFGLRSACRPETAVAVPTVPRGKRAGRPRAGSWAERIAKPILRWTALAVLLAAFSEPSATTAEIKIYINTDLEGASGVFKFEQTREVDTPLNREAREYFMGNLAAVVRGCATAGPLRLWSMKGPSGPWRPAHDANPTNSPRRSRPRNSTSFLGRELRHPMGLRWWASVWSARAPTTAREGACAPHLN